MGTPEGRVKALVKRRFTEIFPLSYRFMPVQNGMGAPALDFYFCVQGKFVAIETKAPGKKPTPRQEQTIAEIEKAGGIVFVIDGPEAIEAALATIKYHL